MLGKCKTEPRSSYSRTPMRVKLELDGSFGLPKELSRVWYTFDAIEAATIQEVTEDIAQTFGLFDKPLALELDGFILLGEQLSGEMITEGTPLKVVAITLNAANLIQGRGATKKRKRMFTPENAAPFDNRERALKRFKWRSPIRNSRMNSSTYPTMIDSSESTDSSTSSDEIDSDSSSSEPIYGAHDMGSDTSSSDEESLSSSSDIESAEESLTSSPSTPEIAPQRAEIATTEQQKQKKKIIKSQAERRAKKDVISNKSRVYINAMAKESTQPHALSEKTDYDALPSISLAEIQVGQIVAWRTLVLSPMGDARLTPWQERQLVSICPQGLVFRIHNPQAYLSEWWIDEDGEKVCTIKQWQDSTEEDLTADVCLPVDSSELADLRLLHNADVT